MYCLLYCLKLESNKLNNRIGGLKKTIKIKFFKAITYIIIIIMGFFGLDYIAICLDLAIREKGGVICAKSIFFVVGGVE